MQPSVTPPPLPAGEPSPRRYLAALAAGLLGALVLFYAGLAALAATGNLPPPSFSNSLCLDEKLDFLRSQPATSPDLLVVGSSVAWRHFDGATVDHGPRGLRPLNGGFCGLHINQSVHMAQWLLDRHPTVRQVVLIAAPQDFAVCHARRTDVVNLRDVDAFVYAGDSRWPYYLRYFDPVSLIGNARRIKHRRNSPAELEALVFNRYGDGPLDTALSRPTLYYGTPEPLDPGCFDALARLAARLKAERRTLLVVSTPLHPDWVATQDPQRRFLNELDERIGQVLKQHGGRYWNAAREWAPGPAAFTDAIHLRWSAVGDFSAALGRQLLAADRQPM